jgi:hypothetical protein
MEETVKNIELIDRFIENERRSKMWTTISVIIFCLLGGVVFYLAYAVNKSNAKYKEQNVVLLATREKLDSTLKLLAIKNESLQGDSATLSNQVMIAEGRSDSLKKFCDTVTLLFKNSESYLFDGDSSFVNEDNLVLSDNLRKIIQNPEKWNIKEKQFYSISFKCMPGKEKIAFAVREKLEGKQFQGKKYAITGIDTIEKFTFNPMVKYFKDEDEGMAKNIAEQINNSGIPFFKDNPIAIQKLSVEAPLSQVEIWIGRYDQKKLDRLFLESTKYKIN